jgi:aminopeptidase N
MPIPAASEAAAQVVLSPTRYELSLELDYAAETLRGTTRIVVKNPSSEPVHEASFLLYRLLRVQSVRDDQGRDLAFSQAVVSFVDFGQLQVNHFLVTLGKPLAPGEETGIQIQYAGYLLGYAETGMRYIQDRIDPEFTILRQDSYAYPQPGYPSSAVNRSAPERSFVYSARITVPKDLVVANGGRQEGIEPKDDSVTFRFSSLRPSWRMDFAIAKYTEVSAGKLRVYHLPGDESGAAGVAQAAEKALNLFSKWFGPLHDASPLTFIEIPDGWGSQADVTTVIQTASAFRDPEQYREVYHEISHLWNVPPTDRPSPRWNEGLASFLEFLVTEEVTGKPVVDPQTTWLVDWLRVELPNHPDWKKVPLVDYGSSDMTDLSYSVGAIFFDLLYRLVGKETFNKIIGRYYADFGVSGGSTNDLVDVIRKTAKIGVSQLANDWLYTAAWTDRIQNATSLQELASYYRRDQQDKQK